MCHSQQKIRPCLYLQERIFYYYMKKLSEINLIPNKEGVNRPNLAGIVVLTGAVVV